MEKDKKRGKEKKNKQVLPGGISTRIKKVFQCAIYGKLVIQLQEFSTKLKKRLRNKFN